MTVLEPTDNGGFLMNGTGLYLDRLGPAAQPTEGRLLSLSSLGGQRGSVFLWTQGLEP